MVPAVHSWRRKYSKGVKTTCVVYVVGRRIWYRYLHGSELHRTRRHRRRHLRILSNPRMPCTTTGTTTRPRMMGARSLHAGGGVNVVYCDGHVTFITNNIDFNTWQAVGTAQGGESLNAEN